MSYSRSWSELICEVSNEGYGVVSIGVWRRWSLAITGGMGCKSRYTKGVQFRMITLRAFKKSTASLAVHTALDEQRTLKEFDSSDHNDASCSTADCRWNLLWFIGQRKHVRNIYFVTLIKCIRMLNSEPPARSLKIDATIILYQFPGFTSIHLLWDHISTQCYSESSGSYFESLWALIIRWDFINKFSSRLREADLAAIFTRREINVGAKMDFVCLIISSIFVSLNAHKSALLACPRGSYRWGYFLTI